MKRSGFKPRPRTKQQVREGDEAEVYAAEVRLLPCCVPATVDHPLALACAGGVQACHEGDGGGMGMKTSFKKLIPMCWWHHILNWTNHDGCFKGWTKEHRATWRAARGADTQALLASHGRRRGVL